MTVAKGPYQFFFRFQWYFTELKNMHESLIGNPGSAQNHEWRLYSVRIFTARQRSCGKVMFSQVPVIVLWGSEHVSSDDH